MPEFSYIARTQEGVRKEDTISAKNINELKNIDWIYKNKVK